MLMNLFGGKNIMKWLNKGHEFDELGNFFKENNRIFIAGTLHDNIALYKKLDFLNCKIERKTCFFLFLFSYLFPPLRDLFFNLWYKYNNLDKETILILNYSTTGFLSGGGNNFLFKRLQNNKMFKLNKNIFFVDDFIQKYLSIFAFYVSNKVYLYNVGITVTTVCNLNCTYCLNFVPYDKNQKHIKLDELKKECDNIFKNIDKVMYFSVSGGEPLLHPDFGELLKYIYSNYKHKIIFNLGPATNGTVIPSDDLCKIFHDCKVTVVCDNYITVDKTCLTYKKLIKQLKKFHVDHKELLIRHFFKMFPPDENYENMYLDSDFISKYDSCGLPSYKVNFTDVKNGRFYGCCYVSFAETAGLIKATDDDYYDISKLLTDAEKKELIEFKLGYCNKGYMSFCKFCNQLTNSKPDMGVEQTKGKLNWSCENPTHSY